MLCYKIKRLSEVCILFLILTILMCGCASQNVGNSQQSEKIATDMTEKAATNIDFNVNDSIKEYIKEIFNKYEKLPIIHAEEVSAEAEEIFKYINTTEILENADEYEIQEIESDAYLHESWVWGKFPWYDCSFTYEIVTKSNLYVHYYLEEFYYIDAILNVQSEPEIEAIESNISNYDHGTLYYEAPEQIENLVNQSMESMGITVVNKKCLLLSQSILQNLYDERSENGTLREQHWGDSGGQYKTHSGTAEKEKWTKEDECYYFCLTQEICDIPVSDANIIALVGNDGIIYLDVENALTTYTQDGMEGLLSYSALMQVLSEILKSIYSDGEVELSNLVLNYSCTDTDSGIYQPIWKASIIYCIMNGDGNMEERTTNVLINAFTGEQIVVKEE